MDFSVIHQYREGQSLMFYTLNGTEEDVAIHIYNAQAFIDSLAQQEKLSRSSKVTVSLWQQ